jgi:murein DD-endopeptidase MepM/ murein hydrolase activator NlpD
MRLFRFTTFLLSALLTLFTLTIPLLAQTVPANTAVISDLQNKISDRNQRIADLEKEIAGYQRDLQDTSIQKSTLQSTIKALELARKKLAIEVSLASSKIDVASDNINTLKSDISTKESLIQNLTEATAHNVRLLNQHQNTSLVEVALSENTLSSFLDKAENIFQFQKNIITTSQNLQSAKKGLETDKAQTEEQKQKLLGYKAELTDKQKVIELTKAQQNTLLIETKNKETSFQKILADKLALKNAFEQELNDFESQLKYQIDPSLLPKDGAKVLAWPLSKIIVTQLFGVTDFAKAHSRLYNGKGHNGVDFGASIGTPVLAPADGTVIGSGNTDIVCKGASYGKWILIQHNNGLSTLYGHLSVFKVTAGQVVQKGDVIAYSGNTGYVTGPHLHFTVFASQGVKIQSLKSRSCGGTYTMPVAAFQAYLDPLVYLPSL